MPAILERMEAHARRVSQESGKVRQDLAAATPARQTRAHLSLALRLQTAPAMRAGRGLMEGHARRAAQASTRVQLDLGAAAAARLTPPHLSVALRSHFGNDSFWTTSDHDARSQRQITTPDRPRYSPADSASTRPTHTDPNPTEPASIARSVASDR